MFNIRSFLAVCLLGFAISPVLSLSTPEKREVIINDGTKVKKGHLPTLNLDYWTTGVLKQNACTYSKHKISNCYTFRLTSHTNEMIDPNGKTQYNWFQTPVRTLPAPRGKTSKYKYTWRRFVETGATGPKNGDIYRYMVISSKGLDNGTHEGTTLVRMESNGPGAHQTGIFYLDDDAPRGTSTSVDKYKGKTTVHELTLQVGGAKGGFYDYKVTDLNSGSTLIKVHQDGEFAIGDVSLWLGFFRNPKSGQTEWKEHFGDFKVTKLI
jgi:hypothetical protein